MIYQQQQRFMAGTKSGFSKQFIVVKDMRVPWNGMPLRLLLLPCYCGHCISNDMDVMPLPHRVN